MAQHQEVGGRLCGGKVAARQAVSTVIWVSYYTFHKRCSWRADDDRRRTEHAGNAPGVRAAHREARCKATDGPKSGLTPADTVRSPLQRPCRRG